MITSLTGIGALKTDDLFPEWLISVDPVAVPLLDSASLRFQIAIDDLPDGLVPHVEEAVTNFLALNPSHRGAITPFLMKNYQEAVDHGASDPLPITDPADLWNYINPLRVNVQQGDVGDDTIYIQIALGCAWEEEHGLQIVFRGGDELVRVSQEDGHMTEEGASGTA